MGIDYIPKLGIEFGFEQEAYGFYNECWGNSGFIFIKDGAIKEKKMAWWLQESLLVVKREIKPHGPESAVIGLNWPIRHESVGFGQLIWTNSTWFGVNPKKKKKKQWRSTYARATKKTFIFWDFENWFYFPKF